MKTNFLLTIGILFTIAACVGATIVDVSVATDKPTYSLGEIVIVSVTAYNPSSESVTLDFGSALQASYLIDGVFDWTEGKVFAHVLTQLTIDPYDSYTWILWHGDKEMNLWPLGIGTHNVRGEVVEYGLSSTIEFEVIPEPTTVLLMAMGVLGIRTKKTK